MKTLNIAILGLGTVGAGTVSLLQANQKEIEKRIGVRINIQKALVRDKHSHRDCDYSNIILTDTLEDITEDESISLVIELLGGTDFAKTATLQAIEKGKAVVTANKALIAEYGKMIFAAAEQHQVSVRYEAAVTGGIPIIKNIREALVANRVSDVVGIVNGTSNFILSQMSENDVSFDVALKKAQSLGYAEADSIFDINGTDAAHKIKILACLAFGIDVPFGEVYVEGITKIEAIDISLAVELGYHIKHLAIASTNKDDVEIRVHLALIPSDHMMAKVTGVDNAVLTKSDALGDLLSCGAGAGALPTATAIVADVVDIIRGDYVPLWGVRSQFVQTKIMTPITQRQGQYYLRLVVKNKEGVVNILPEILNINNVPLENCVQKIAKDYDDCLLLVFLTKKTREFVIDRVIEQYNSLELVIEPVVSIRVEEL